MGRQFSGQRLRAARRAAGLGVDQLAHRVGRSASAVSAYEREHARPSVPVLAALCDALDCATDDLFEPSNPPVPVAAAATVERSPSDVFPV